MAQDTDKPARIEVVDSLHAVPADAWDALAGAANPFVKHAYLVALEDQHCVGPGTGWHPSHVLARRADDTLLGAMPLYLKADSWGEFVFDFAWADAYRRSGLDYYPKLVAALPFTPVPGPRLLVNPAANTESTSDALVGAARQLATDTGASSLHVLFPTGAEHESLTRAGLTVRKDCQFHWRNRGYTSFDDFLATFSSKKRKQVRRERRIVADQGFTLRTVTGDNLDEAQWTRVYELYASTFLVRGREPYFTPGLFGQLARTMGSDVLVALAQLGDHIAAMAIFFRGPQTLYGRYWGADRDYDCLHFETCYYQGIELCIEQGLDVFEPGTQGEHKITRGFEPTATWSAHWLADRRFAQAIDDYLAAERRQVDDYMLRARQRLPFRATGAGPE